MATTLTPKQEELAEALYRAYRRNFFGLPNEPLKMSDWEGVVTDDDTAYAVQDAVMAKKMGPVAGYKVSLRCTARTSPSASCRRPARSSSRT